MSKKLENFAIGFGLYYLMVYGLLFFPAIVMMEQFGSLDDWADYGDPSGLIAGALAGGITIIIILFLCGLFVRYQSISALLLLISIYLFFLWPFIQWVKWMYSDNIYNDIPFPGFDWIPFW